MHVPYRAAFRALNARLHWLRAIWNRDDRNSPERLESAFESAFRDFDLASAGLSGANFQIAAINELYRVEAALARARLAIHFQALHEETEGDLVEGNVEGGIDARLGLASAKGEAARIGLQRARVYLNQGRRNVIRWKHFYTMAAQYHSERLLVGLVRLIRMTSKRRDTDPNLPRQGNDPSAAEVYNRLRRGYSAIRLAYELQLPGENTIPLWLKRTWLETTAAGYCLGQLYLDELVRRNLGPNHIPTDQDRDANRKYVRETLEVLMGSQLKKWFVRDELKVAANNLLEYCDYWFEWNDKSKRENYRSADALQFRSELLEAIVKGIYPEDPTADNADGTGGFGLLSFKKWLDLK